MDALYEKTLKLELEFQITRTLFRELIQIYETTLEKTTERGQREKIVKSIVETKKELKELEENNLKELVQIQREINSLM